MGEIISKAEVCEILADIYPTDGEKVVNVKQVDKAYEAIQQLPSAQPEQKWIPVSKKFPDTPGMYTVTDSKGDVVRFVFYDTESSREYWLRCAKAWMPLPEPYRAERRTDEGD